jgi:2-keto-3-deoxy-L-rhamnonate aldolase RhmA
MATIVNPARARLEKGEVSLGLGIRMARGVEIAKLLKTAGYDWLFLDLEHGPLTLDAACQIATAALDAGIAPIVRVPAGEIGMATRALDGGALGIVMPHVDTPEEAREIATKLRYAPQGTRSPAGPSVQLDFKAVPVGEANAAINAAILVVVMVETEQAIANVDAIAAVPGVDGIMIGTNDLATEMGIPGEFAHPRIVAAYEATLAACRRHRKIPGMGGVRQNDQLARYVGMGMRLILAGGDTGMLMQAAGGMATFIRGLEVG